jgi:hypothetical protein
MLRRVLWLQVLALLLAACGGDSSLPPTAQPEIMEMLRADLEAVPHPSDGGGRGWLVAEESDVPAVASQRGRWTIEYEAGPEGIAVGGALYLQVSPFWGWSTPQVVYSDVPGYSEVTTAAEGVELEPATVDQQLMAITIRGRDLVAGERIRIVYGAGLAGAFADRYAESESRFWLAVDGDGDGRRSVLADSPAVPVVAGAASQLLVHLPATARPGESVELTVAMADPVGNRVTDVAADMELAPDPALPGWPRRLSLYAEDGGSAVFPFDAPAEGVMRIAVTTADGIEGESNPLVVSDGPRIVWADLHGHSGLSDGTGTVRDFLLYARDTSGLDVVALTDHDHWGVQPLAKHPEIWEEIRAQTESFHEPGRFVTLLGFEWTNWVYGHRHVLYFDGEGEVVSSVDRRFGHPEQLWDALRGKPALTFAHHTAGGPVATDWRIPPDPELEPLTEIVSVHGSSEAPDSPFPIYRPVSGNFARDALDRGYRLGFVGSGDGHDGHPGLAHVSSPQMGGLAAILTEELTRDAVLEALRARRTYATNGPRIVLRATLGGLPMGSVVPAGETLELAIEVVGITALHTIDVVRSGEVLESLECDERPECSVRVALSDLVPGEYVYVRALQEDGGAAWSSPFFVE